MTAGPATVGEEDARRPGTAVVRETTTVPWGSPPPWRSPSGPVDDNVVSIELDKKTDTEVVQA